MDETNYSSTQENAKSISNARAQEFENLGSAEHIST